MQTQRSAMESLETRLCMSTTVTTTTTTGISVADLNGDGKRDLITTRFGHSGGVTVRFGNGDGTFGAATFPAGYRFARGSVSDIADFDHDGDIDIVIYGGHGGSGTTLNGGLYILLNNGNGTFAAPTLVSDVNFHGRSLYSLNNVKIAVGLIDGDNNVDIVVTDPNIAFRGRHRAYRPETYLLTGNGDGTFNSGVAIT